MTSVTPPVVPELDVSDLNRSLSFYQTVLGFRIHAERPEERFAYLLRGEVHLMLQEAQGPGRRFRTALLEYPFGRGINLQIEVSDVDHLCSKAGSCPRAWCSFGARRAFRTEPGTCQLAAGRLMSGSSLIVAMVSSVM
ncbi:VOC family protein [Pleomorphomonas koreensis]|uniref:VOC family protein n=1 Tax=Pleomorphomonas koreensis TaxID=257440 RepID=UPI0012EC804F